MTTRIWKFPLADLVNAVGMPAGARVLTVQCQRGQPVMWAAVEPDAATETRTFEWVGTGLDVPPECNVYTGTVQMHGGDLVLHLFEHVASYDALMAAESHAARG